MPISPFGGLSILAHIGIILTRKSLALSHIVSPVPSARGVGVAYPRLMKSMSIVISALVVVSITLIVSYVVRSSISSPTSNAHVLSRVLVEGDVSRFFGEHLYYRSADAEEIEAFNAMLSTSY